MTKNRNSVDVCGVRVNEQDRWKQLKPQFEKELSTLPEEYKRRLKPLLKEFSDIFSVTKNDIGFTNLIEHEIDTGGVKPIACQNRRIPFGLEEKVDKLIQELVDKNIIRPSESPWNAPLVVIPKKNGDLRLTVDFRQLNSVTKRPIFPIPDANQLFDTLKGSIIFSTLDLSSGYYNIPMKEEDVAKTAFSTRTNHWEFIRMPMGISTAPATFQRLMHKIFEKEKWYECLIYIVLNIHCA
ncbi:MAG: reverse transcriptase family protein [Pseudomonadota bacterium]